MENVERRHRAALGHMIQQVRLLDCRRTRVARVPFWWHSVDLGKGLVTPGHKSTETLAEELEALHLPELAGKTVLDVGGWDGFFAFEAERQGASRVAVLDHYVWSLDLAGQQRYWRECAAAGVDPEPNELTEFWHPETLPGRAGFDTARELLDSRVNGIAGDFMTYDLDELGLWDIVLYLGVLYHMKHPLAALERLAKVTRDTAIIETEAVMIPGQEDQALWQFFPGAELNHDISNWWAPTAPALTGALRAAGFREAVMFQPPPAEIGQIVHYRAVVHALK
jgi:tRNA (mo5U34)-methyltransferase